MRTTFERVFFVAVVSCAAGFLGQAAHAEEQDAAAIFGSLPLFKSASLSPTGKYIAAIQPSGSHEGVRFFPITEAGVQPASRTFGFSDGIVRSAYWKSDDELIVTVTTDIKYNNTTGYKIVQMSVSPQGNEIKGVPSNADMYLRTLGFLPSTSFANGRDGVPKAAITYMADRNTKFGHFEIVKAKEGGGWWPLDPIDEHARDHAAIVAMSEDDKSALILSRHDGDRIALYPIDLETGAWGAPLFSDPKYDVSEAVTDSVSERVIGVGYRTDKREYLYFEPKLEGLEKALLQKFPDLSVEIISATTDRSKSLIILSGPKHPATLHMYDAVTHHFDDIGSSYPALDKPEVLSDMKPYPYAARDGLQLSAYLTIPAGKEAKNLPLVVLPHGGPEERDSLAFDWMVQFLGSKGYAVLQPNFRGSYGYGYAFEAAGFQQWGRKMQDDITDGVNQAIKDGIANPKRVCIVGVSYGGYAALAGAALTPDLYACAASVAGVSDLPKLIDDRNPNWPEQYLAALQPEWDLRFGKRYADEAGLKAVSPAFQADKVRVPILLIHADKDSTVPIEHSLEMQAALQKAGKSVKFVKVVGDDHYMETADSRMTVLRELDAFLAANIGNTKAAAN